MVCLRSIRSLDLPIAPFERLTHNSPRADPSRRWELGADGRSRASTRTMRAEGRSPVRYSTTFTIGCVDSVRYSSSSCSRLVAVMVMVSPR